jgi:hypothetical protein
LVFQAVLHANLVRIVKFFIVNAVDMPFNFETAQANATHAQVMLEGRTGCFRNDLHSMARGSNRLWTRLKVDFEPDCLINADEK